MICAARHGLAGIVGGARSYRSDNHQRGFPQCQAVPFHHTTSTSTGPIDDLSSIETICWISGSSTRCVVLFSERRHCLRPSKSVSRRVPVSFDSLTRVHNDCSALTLLPRLLKEMRFSHLSYRFQR